MIIIFTQLSITLFKLEKYSMNINMAVCLMEKKNNYCAQNTLYRKHFKISHKMYGKFLNINFTEFKWICSYKQSSYCNGVNRLLINIRKHLKKSCEESILLTLYLILRKILCKRLVDLDVIILWNKNYIKTTTNVNL